MSAPPDNPTIHAALYNASTGRPNRPAIESLFQAISAAIASVTGGGGGGGGVWGAITGTLSSQADLITYLVANFAGKIHTHTLSAILDAGTAASKAVPASGNAGSTQVVLGSDTRLADARTPTAHGHAESEITGLTLDIAIAKLLSVGGHIEVPVVKTYVLDESTYWPGSIAGITHRCIVGSLTFSVQINGANVTGLSGLTSNSTQASPTSTAANTYAAGQRITVVVASISSPTAPADFVWTLKRAST